MKKKTLLTSILIVVMCLSLAIGGTFALFTSESNVDIAVTSGKVSLTATIDQNSVATKKLYDTEYTNGANNMYEGIATFTNEGLTLTNFIPGDGIKFNIIVKNESNVTVKYRTTISCYEDNGLFAGLDVTIGDRENYNGNEYVTNWATLLVGSSDIIVPVEIVLPENAGNDYQEKTCKISYAVEAVQGNAKTTNVSNTVELDGNATSSATFGTNGVDSPTVEMPASLLNDIHAEGKTDVALMHSEQKIEGNVVSFDSIEIVDANGNVIDLEAMGNTEEFTVTFSVKGSSLKAGDVVYIYHDGKHIATSTVQADGEDLIVTYTATHFCEVELSNDFLGNVSVNNEAELVKYISKVKAGVDVTIVLNNDITLTKQINLNSANKNAKVVIDLNGNKLDANLTNAQLFQIYSNQNASLELISSKAGAEINVPNGKKLALAYGDLKISNVAINADEVKSTFISMSNGALTIDDGAEINVNYLGSSLIDSNKAVVIDGAKINVEEFKTNAGTLISNYKFTPVTVTNSDINIVLNHSYKQYFINWSNGENVVFENNNVVVADDMGYGYEYEIKAVEHIDAEGYGFVAVATEVSTADELMVALEESDAKVIRFKNDITIDPANMSSGYGATGINVLKGQMIDGNGYTLNIGGAGGTWDSGINIVGGAIFNIKVTGSFRGIFINHNEGVQGKVYLNKVTIEGTVYTISCDQGTNNGLEAIGCTFNGWTSFAETLGEATFKSCNFGEGNGYAYCRPYATTTFESCKFAEGYTLDPAAKVTFKYCRLGSVALTSENLSTLIDAYIGSSDNAKVEA